MNRVMLQGLDPSGTYTVREINVSNEGRSFMGMRGPTENGRSYTGDYLMSEDNMINGYPCYVTNSIVSTYGTGGDGNMVVFGNWADLMIGQWGGYDITVDPYTAAKTNQIVIVINAYFDAKGLRGVNGTSGANLDEYALSFAAESIK